MRGKLFFTPNSPYARVARIAARKAGLRPLISEHEVRTRQIGTPYFNHTPLGRVPYYEDAQVRLADTREICAYFDRRSALVALFPDETSDQQFLRHVACGFLDGVAVWLRENARPEGQRSTRVMDYEAHRARHILQWMEGRVGSEVSGSYTALVLACTLDIARARGMDRDWSEIAPGLLDWAAEMARDPDMCETAPEPL